MSWISLPYLTPVVPSLLWFIFRASPELLRHLLHLLSKRTLASVLQPPDCSLAIWALAKLQYRRVLSRQGGGSSVSDQFHQRQPSQSRGQGGLGSPFSSAAKASPGRYSSSLRTFVAQQQQQQQRVSSLAHDQHALEVLERLPRATVLWCSLNQARVVVGLIFYFLGKGICQPQLRSVRQLKNKVRVTAHPHILPCCLGKKTELWQGPKRHGPSR